MGSRPVAAGAATGMASSRKSSACRTVLATIGRELTRTDHALPCLIRMPAPALSLTDYSKRVAVTLALVTLALFLWKIAPVLMLAFAGIVFAGVFRAAGEPLARWLRIGETWAIAIVFALFIALALGLAYFFGTAIATQATELSEAIRTAIGKAQAALERSPIGNWLVENGQAATDPAAMGKVVKGTATVFGGLADVVLVIFLSLYFAVDPQSYRSGFLLLLPAAARERVGKALDASGVALRRWLLGQLVAMTMVGTCTALGLWLVGVPLAIPLGILSGILDFVPFVGPLLAAIPGLLVAFAQGPEVAVYAGLVYLGVQFAEGHLILPLVQKWAVHLPPVVGLLSIVAFTLVFGVMGLLFATPLAVVAIVLVKRLWIDNEQAPT
jgi:predicted PurR-regulated permease PerM